jgi:glycosyltransferase involved in cell wall biosynthesis
VLFLPAHDEEASVAAVIARAPEKLCERLVLLVVIDDGSRDRTVERARHAGAMVVSSSANEGLGAALRRGLHIAVSELDAAAVAFCDADGEYAPEELERLVAPVLDGTADYVVGSRFSGDIQHMLPHRRFGNIVLTRITAFCARTRITDGQSGYRAFSADAARAAEVLHDYNYAQVITLDLIAKGYRYLEVPISYRFRQDGRSFVRLGRYLRKVTPAVFRELNTPSGE